MKRLFSLITGFLLISASSWANVITVQAFSADSSVTHLENFRTISSLNKKKPLTTITAIDTIKTIRPIN